MSDQRARVVTRRRLLEAGSAAVTVGLAGCIASSTPQEPEPIVVHTDPTDVSDVSGEQTVEATMLVHNTGADGEIVVTVATFAGPENPIANASKTVQMKGDTQRKVRVNATVPIEGQELVATARPANESREGQ